MVGRPLQSQHMASRAVPGCSCSTMSVFAFCTHTHYPTAHMPTAHMRGIPPCLPLQMRYVEVRSNTAVGSGGVLNSGNRVPFNQSELSLTFANDPSTLAHAFAATGSKYQAWPHGTSDNHARARQVCTTFAIFLTSEDTTAAHSPTYVTSTQMPHCTTVSL